MELSYCGATLKVSIKTGKYNAYKVEAFPLLNVWKDNLSFKKMYYNLIWCIWYDPILAIELLGSLKKKTNVSLFLLTNFKDELVNM